MACSHMVVLVLTALLAGCAAPAPTQASAHALRCVDPCASTIDLGAPAREVSIAVDPHDASHLVVVAALLQRSPSDGVAPNPAAAVGPLAAAASFDAGRTWAARMLPFPTPVAIGDDAPALILDDGTVLVVGLGVVDATPRQIARSIYAWRSTDGGRSWPAPTVVEPGRGAAAGETTSHDHDGPEIAARGNDVLLAWGKYDRDATDSFTATYSARVSHDGGRTWGAASSLASGPEVNDGWPAILADGTLVVAWNDHANTLSTPPAIAIRAAASTDRGATWRAVDVANGTTSIWPRLAASSTGGVVLCSTEKGPDGSDAWVTRSSPDGLGWSERTVAATHGHLLRPAPVCAAGTDGAAWLAGYDDARAFRIVHARASLVLDKGPTGVGDGAKFGEYMGLAATPDGAVAAWVSGSGEATRLAFARVTEV